MRLRISHPLFSGFLGVVGFLALITVFLAGNNLRVESIALFEAELRRELDLSAELTVLRGNADYDSLVRMLADRLGHRVTLISLDGDVIGDSDVPREQIAGMESHAGRPEVIGALSGTTAFAERESTTVGAHLLYGARVVSLGDESVVLRYAASLETIERSVASTRRILSGAGILAIVLAVLISYFLSRNLARPMATLVETARALSSGDLSQRAPRTFPVRELDELAAAFNRLSEELEIHLNDLGQERDEMQALIDCMAEGVIALTEDARVLRANRAARSMFELPKLATFAPVGTLFRHEELRVLLERAVLEPFQAGEVTVGDRHLLASSRPLDHGGAVVTFLDITEIRRLEQIRRDFVANASHELKTPLTAMRGFAETLLESDPPDHLRKEFLETIRRNTLRLQNIVDDLLDLSRMESGGWVADLGTVDVRLAATAAWHQVADDHDVSEVDFTVVGDVEANADPDGLSHIFRNIFDNAVRYTPPGGTVTVHLTAREESVEVSVVDTGSGVPAAALPRLFERFYRVDHGRDREAGGTGLGLAIVRHLVGAMGGSVWAESHLGEGLVIRFTLPVAIASDSVFGSS